MNMPEESNDTTSGRIGINELTSTVGVLSLINENGDLCKDGLRAVRLINELGNQLIDAIEVDEGVAGVADYIHETTNNIKHEKAMRGTAKPS